MTKKPSIGVIILNYYSYKDTINCISSFKNSDTNEFDIKYVIVDNGSANESYEVLSNKYKKATDIHIIKLETNRGFANGNNAGCDFLRKKYNCDYFIFSNSDILVPKNIFSWIHNTYVQNNCDILGPDIYAQKMGIHQNPIKQYTKNKMIVDLKIIKKKIEILLLKLKIINKKILSEKFDKDNVSSDKKIFNCPVHGSFIISNNKIFNYYEDFFDKGTFLYMEEYLLYLRCQKNGLKTMVSLDNTVIHLQGKSTDTNMINNRKKVINRIQREVDSLIIYRKRLNEMDKR